MTIREKLNAADKKHRRDFAEYAIHDSASDWHREMLDRLYTFWDSANRDYFENACVKPHILLNEPKVPQALGDHANVSGWGSRNQIRLRPSLITGQHKLLKPGDEYAEGRMRFVEDVLLHESVHQYCDEVLHTPETSYKGHGPTFAGECNRIGERLGLPPVRPAKARGKLKELPSCASWPHNVRPADYYLGALAEPEPKAGDDEDPGDEDLLTFPCPIDPAEALPVLAAHYGEEARRYIAAGWGYGPVDGEPVAEKQVRQTAAPVAGNGDGKAQAPKHKPARVPASRDKPAESFHKGDRVRYIGTGKPKPNGTIHSVHASSLDGTLYLVKWDDGTEGFVPAAELEHVRRGRRPKQKPAKFSVNGDVAGSLKSRLSGR
jgi:hypothetical protein